LAAHPRFTSVAGTAEATTLPEHAVDIITAAQAAHWFDCGKARREFQGILKPAGWLALIWNERCFDANRFSGEYEDLVIQYGTDYLDVRHQGAKRAVEELFASSSYQVSQSKTQQKFDYPALEGRLLSSSYSPPPDHPNYRPMLAGLRRIFDAHQMDGQVTFDYDTQVFYGRLG
jgi:hypothetical protein